MQYFLSMGSVANENQSKLRGFDTLALVTLLECRYVLT